MSHTLSFPLFYSGSTATQALFKWACLCLSLLLCTLPMAAQESTRKIVGKVTAAPAGTPVEGATVKARQGKATAITNGEGAFTLVVPAATSTLIVSMVGFADQEISVRNSSNAILDISLQREENPLDEVIVVGYGKQKKGEVTGAAVSVKSEDFVKGFARDAGQLIQGKVAGLAVVTSSGDPNALTQISLRGNSTIMSSTEPLVLIDGVPGALNTVAPEDIESVDVLKDGSAAAIYGTRGTNGVVLITTRKRTGSRPSSMSYDAFVSVQTIARKMDFLTADDYRRLIKEGIGFTDYGTSTDWLKEVTRTPVSYTHNLSLQGGTGTSNYVASVNVRSWQGLFNRSDNKQVTGRLELNHIMFDGKLKFNMGIIARNRNYFYGADYAYAYRQTLIRNPTDSVYDYQGKWKEDPSGYFYDNPVRSIQERTGDARVSELRLNGNVIFSPVKDLNLKLLLSSVKTPTLYGSYETFNNRASELNGRTGYAYRATGLTQDNLMELTGDYTKKISDHKMTLLGGYSYQSVTQEGFNASNSNFPTDLYTYNRLQSGDALLLQNAVVAMNSNKENAKLIGFFGRFNYSWNDKYLLMASLRHEGSTKFGANYKWGTFPAVSVGWRISKESFMSDATVVNDLKLRAGYGVTGTVPTDPYQSLISLNYEDRFLYNGTWIQGISPVRNPNPDLRWEKKNEFNFGLDFSLLNNRVSGSIDLYQRDTKDMLYDFPVPVPPNLYGSTLANAGEMRNKGIEVLLNYVAIQTRDFTFSNNFTYSYNKNTLVAISNELYKTTNDFIEAGYTGEPIQEATHRVQVGLPIGNFYGYKSIDIDDEGKWIIEGQDGKPKKLSEANPSDKKILGNGVPKHTASWNFSLQYKKLSLSVNMRGAFGYQILNFQRLFYENPKIVQYNMLASAFDNVYGKRRLNNDLAYVSYYLENGDHWKIDNVTLGYTIGIKNTKYLKSARVYVSGLNLLVLTGYKGIDPEVTRQGLDAGNDARDKYPTTRTFTLGANFVF